MSHAGGREKFQIYKNDRRDNARVVMGGGGWWFHVGNNDRDGKGQGRFACWSRIKKSNGN